MNRTPRKSEPKSKILKSDTEFSPVSEELSLESESFLAEDIYSQGAQQSKNEGKAITQNEKQSSLVIQSLQYELATAQSSQSMRVGRLLQEGSRTFGSFLRVLLLIFESWRRSRKTPKMNTQMLIRGLKMPSGESERKPKSLRPASCEQQKPIVKYNENRLYVDSDTLGEGCLELHLKAANVAPDILFTMIKDCRIQFSRSSKWETFAQKPVRNINDAGELVCAFVIPKGGIKTRVFLEKPVDVEWSSISTEIHYFQRGISVIVPTHQGLQNLPRLLSNISSFCEKRQNSECVFVTNGADDGSFQYLKKYRQEHGSNWLKIFRIEQASIGGARNIGISNSVYDHAMFLDDDDILSLNFGQDITGLLDGKNIVVISLSDLIGDMAFASPVSYQVESCQGMRDISCSFLPAIYSMNACKIAPSYLLRMSAFDEEMKRNEDVLFWSRIASIYRPLNTVTARNSPSIYLRQLTVDSLSRQYADYDAQVVDRIDTIRQLVNLISNNRCYDKSFVMARIRDQFEMLRVFRKRFPKYTTAIDNLCQKSGLDVDELFKRIE